LGVFDWISGSSSKAELPELYSMPIGYNDFVTIDVRTIYNRILTDVFERTEGVPEQAKPLLWDNCLASNKQDGLVSMLSKAMASKSELFLVYRPELKVIRVATQEETSLIKADYAAKGESSTGIYITFKNFEITDMVRFYSGLEYCAVAGLWKQGNLSTAIQLKISDLRSSVSLVDKAVAEGQAKAIADGLAAGKSVAMDGKDEIVTQAPDLTATKAAIEFITQKRSSYLGLPASYFTGDLATGLADSGKADRDAVDRGLKAWFFSIGKPVADGIFGVNAMYKSQDNEGAGVALEMLKTFDLTSNDFISAENKLKQVNKAFGLPEDAKGDPPVKVDPLLDQSKPLPPKDNKGVPA
jgi:hypothetical protein